MPSPVLPSIGPPDTAWTGINDYGGGSTILYSGLAKSIQQPFTLTVTSVSKASSAVVTVTAHGLDTDNIVTVTGGTGEWTGVNGAQIITKVDANSFTIPVATTGYSGSFAGSISTLAPRTSAACWSIQKYYYSGSNLVRSAWANGNAAANAIWDNRATTGFE